MVRVQGTGKFPKVLPPLTEEQEFISNDFMNYWHEVLPARYGIVEKFNHGYPLRSASQTTTRTLDIGAGRGEHLYYENLSDQEYTALELRQDMADAIQHNHPQAKVIVGDCQERIPAPDDYFDRVLAIHVLEHLPDLPRALNEVQRVLKPGGLFSVVIPCEGGWAYTLARRISAQRVFEQRYRQSYDWFIGREHINLPCEIIPALQRRFSITHRSFFPLVVPIVTINLCIGLTLVNHK